MNGAQMSERRDRIKKALLFRLAQSSGDLAFTLNPLTAKLVHEQTSFGNNGVLLETTCLYRNEHGHYFVFIYMDGDNGYLKQILPQEARHMLVRDREAFEAEFGPRTKAGESIH